MASGNSDINIENTNIKTASGVSLDDQQKTLVGSVLDYGLQAAFKEIERLHHEVTDGGNPIGIDLKTRYVVKGIGKEQTISSKVNIFYDKDTGKITKVQDKWDGQLPDSSFTNIFRQLNSVTVPTLISVPKNDEEDRQRGNQ
ncbi:MAG: hypothetical protein Q9195_000636 [Heterodermia aff. obscurata]